MKKLRISECSFCANTGDWTNPPALYFALSLSQFRHAPKEHGRAGKI
ncbi:hypothetical protein [Rhodoferax sp. UBA5149]|nr:hypothetical protein [Rhodoferax sp. UBA5149]